MFKVKNASSSSGIWFSEECEIFDCFFLCFGSTPGSFLGSVMFALIYSVENHDFLLSAQKMLFSGVF